MIWLLKERFLVQVQSIIYRYPGILRLPEIVSGYLVSAAGNPVGLPMDGLPMQSAHPDEYILLFVPKFPLMDTI